MAAKFIVLFLMCIVVISKGINIGSMKLEQVLILSRHNVRTPLTGELEAYAAKPWPKWNDPVGYLTKKGVQLEKIMGEYIAQWLDSEEFIEGCPKKDEVLIYANTKPRTIATAEAFAESAFHYCNVTVEHYKNLSVFDPIFLPIFHNNSEAFMTQVREEMTNKLEEVNLTDAYLELGKMLDIQTSDVCKKLFLCDLSTSENDIVTENGEEPNVSGPLFIGNVIVDSFIMSYYEGLPIEDIAWGNIKNNETWKLLTKISRENQNVRFNLTTGSKDLAGPLLRYMFDIFKNGTPKFTMLVGHDSNLNPVVSALDFKPFVLPHQFEPFPIGGKIIFQKWVDDVEAYLKVEYVYPSIKQIREANILTLLEPPQRVLLKLKGCAVSPNGFCTWTDFMKLNVYS